MNISYNWIKDYLNISHTPDELASILTAIGLEVEGTQEFESVKGGLKGLVVGKVLECKSHPNADKLSLTLVDTGGEAPLEIICGAPNVAAGQHVIVAPVGSTIFPTEGEPFKIGKAKIRGISSSGMICSKDEIGLGTDRDGIMVLEGNPEPGTAVSDLFEVVTDTVFDIGLTPNRSDATSHIGVAGDLLAYLRVNEDYNQPLQLPDLSVFEAGNSKEFKIEVEDTDACPRYSGLIIEGVQVGDSPEWLKNKLKSVGVRPINNVVDITNFVLQEYGQPLHAFDLDKIQAPGIVVTHLPEGTSFITLDEEERKLSEEDLMICDADKNPLCIAGVFGGKGTGVTQTSSRIFLESAHFNSTSVRKTSTRHLLRTDAAKIYEKGSDPSITVTALKRAALLINEWAGGKVASVLYDHYPKEIFPAEIPLNFDRVRKMTGTLLSNEEITRIVRAMDMEVADITAEGLLARVPTNKSDVLREADLIEEILRIYGFDKVPFGENIKIPLINTDYPDKNTLTNRVAEHLTSLGLSQMMNISLSRSSYYEEGRKDLVYIHNTSNEKLNIMRADMVYSAMETLVHNVNRRQTDLAFYEFGRTYFKSGKDIVESEHLILALTGNWQSGNWIEGDRETSIYVLRSLVESVLDKVGVTFSALAENEEEKYDYGVNYMLGKEKLGTAGKVSAALCRKNELDQEFFYAELNWPLLVRFSGKYKVLSEPINRFPSSGRDLALIVGRECKFADIEEIIRKTGGRILDSVELFDVYMDAEKLGSDKKSYAVNMVFSDPDKTLTDKQIDKAINKILGGLKHHLGAELR